MYSDPFSLSIVFATAELSPLATSGGLGDVSAALPRALAALGQRVAIFLPFYQSARERLGSIEHVTEIAVPGFAGRHPLRRRPAGDGEPELFLIENGPFFDRAGLYGDSWGDYGDNLERFAFFSRAVLEAVAVLGLRADVVHLNDWHTGLGAAYRRVFHPLVHAPVVFTIHNLAYQGRFGADRFPATGLPGDVFRPEGVEFYGQLNCLKAGLVYADAITTVSPKYAAEILTPEYGEGLDGVLRSRAERLSGILNGIDTERWNPMKDPFLPVAYGRDDLAGKAECRRALLEELGLQVAPEIPVIGMVTRLTWQKGSDVVLGIAAELLRGGSPKGPGTALVLLGSGDAALEKGFRELAARFPDRVAVRIGYDEPLSHRIEAGADVFLMPSRYEPCGLNQMYSLRYGTVPIVRACGGLDDTVIDVGADPSRGTGFKFDAPTGVALLEALDRACTAFRNLEGWREIMRRGMAEDFSWARSASRYLELYVRLSAEAGPGSSRVR